MAIFQGLIKIEAINYDAKQNFLDSNENSMWSWAKLFYALVSPGCPYNPFDYCLRWCHLMDIAVLGHMNNVYNIGFKGK